MSGAFFFLYLAFAIFIFVSSLSFLTPAAPLLFEIPFFADVYLAGAVDILFALIAGAVIHARFHGKIEDFVARRMPFLRLLKINYVLIAVIGFGLIVVWFLIGNFVNLGLFFFLLILIYFLKNFLYTMFGKSKEIVLERFAKTYYHGLLAPVLAIVISIPIYALSALPFIPVSLASLVVLNAVSIYYTLMAYDNLKIALNKKKPKKDSSNPFGYLGTPMPRPRP